MSFFSVVGFIFLLYTSLLCVVVVRFYRFVNVKCWTRFTCIQTFRFRHSSTNASTFAPPKMKTLSFHRSLLFSCCSDEWCVSGFYWKNNAEKEHQFQGIVAKFLWHFQRGKKNIRPGDIIPETIKKNKKNGLMKVKRINV